MRTCALCLIDYPIEEIARESHYVYCHFCYDRQNRIRAAYRRAMGKHIQISDLHRAYRHWRKTPELDSEYFTPAPPRRQVPPTWHETEGGVICAYRRQIETILPTGSAVVNGAVVKRGASWQQTIYTVQLGADVFKCRKPEDAARYIYQLTKEQEQTAA